jgi:hypothetical protein
MEQLEANDPRVSNPTDIQDELECYWKDLIILQETLEIDIEAKEKENE